MLKKLLMTVLMIGLMSPIALAQTVDYDLFTKILMEYVDENGRVDYKGLKKNEADLDLLIDQFEQADVENFANQTEELAFWINAYNAITLRVVRDAYPARTIRLINFGLVWKIPRKVAQTKHSLEHIEHGIIRPMGDPRIHFALNCASIGCPELPQEAFLPERLEEQLERESLEFLNHPRNVRLDREKNILYYSELLDWFEEDFLEVSDSIKDYILIYLNEEDKEFVLANNTPVESMDYDWGLNAQE